MTEHILVLYSDGNHGQVYGTYFTLCTIVTVPQQLGKYHHPPSNTDAYAKLSIRSLCPQIKVQLQSAI